MQLDIGQSIIALVNKLSQCSIPLHSSKIAQQATPDGSNKVWTSLLTQTFVFGLCCLSAVLIITFVHVVAGNIDRRPRAALDRLGALFDAFHARRVMHGYELFDNAERWSEKV
jgi:hypothetical protein